MGGDQSPRAPRGWTGTGERIWRPLNNPPTLQTNSFVDKNPRGFGLMQRDRNFDNYQDDGAFYNKRPGIWVEPRGDWGEGAVQLVEIPTDDETHDNIVAYWQPKSSVTEGQTFKVDYRLYWQAQEPPMRGNQARVVATRIGRGGIPGVSPPPAGKRKFVIDFEGGPLAQMDARFDVTPVVTPSRGKVENAYVVKVVGTNRWRALFDIDADTDSITDLGIGGDIDELAEQLQIDASRRRRCLGKLLDEKPVHVCLRPLRGTSLWSWSGCAVDTGRRRHAGKSRRTNKIGRAHV